MHSNTSLLNKFYKGIQDHDHGTIADCYHPKATFKDIAFALNEKKKIHAMWHMIARPDLRISFNVEGADANKGATSWVADYTFKDTGREVHNVLNSTFQFRDGLIISQVDDCNPWKWGMQALGPVKGFGSWLFQNKRRKMAMDKLHAFIKQHPEYQ